MNSTAAKSIVAVGSFYLEAELLVQGDGATPESSRMRFFRHLLLQPQVQEGFRRDAALPRDGF